MADAPDTDAPHADAAGDASRRVSTGGPWEAAYGYARAVRRGATVAVSGTTASAHPDVIGGTAPLPPGAADQARLAFEVALAALARLGATPADVIRTRMFVVDIAADGEAVGRVHAALFGAHPPAATMVEVTRLIRPDLRVEVEIDAVVAG